MSNFWIDLPFTGSAGGGGGGTGTVTSVGLTDSSTGSIFGITGSPVTTAGNINITFPSPGPVGNVLTSFGSTWASSAFSGGGGGGGSGTVTSVGLIDADPTNLFNIGGSPVTVSGNISLGLQPTSSNFVLAGPASSGAVPSFRRLAQSDIPAPSLATTGFGGVTGILPVANGGTSLSTLSSSGVLIGNGVFSPTFVSPGTAYNVLQSFGGSWGSASLNQSLGYNTSAGQGIPNNSDTIINYGTLAFSNTNIYSVATGASWTLTFHQAGLYLVGGAILFLSSITGGNLTALQNGGSSGSYVLSELFAGTNGLTNPQYNGFTLMSANVNDTLQFTSYQVNGTAATVNLFANAANNYMQIQKVG